MDNTVGSITGTATFETVELDPQKDGTTHVRGYYYGDTTTYNVPNGCLFVGGLQVDFDKVDQTPVTLKPETDDGWVWVKATEDHLRITKENPDDE